MSGKPCRGRVARRAEEGPLPGAAQQRGDVVPHEIGTGRPEAHHRDVGAVLRHAQPVVGVVELAPVPVEPVVRSAVRPVPAP